MRPLIIVPIALVCAAGAEEAPKPPPDIGEELSQARKAWHRGDLLGSDALRERSVEKLDQQEAAYKDAEKFFRAGLDKDSQHPLCLAEYGRFCLARRQYTRARALLDSALNSPRARVFSPGETADILRTLGGLFERAGEYNVALDHYQQALKLYPSDSRNVLSLAVALCATGRSEEAVPLLRSWDDEKAAATARPDRPAVLALGLYTLALALEETGMPEDALRIYKKGQDAAEKDVSADVSGVAEMSRMAVARLEDMFDAMHDHAELRARENELRAKQNKKPLPDERTEFAEAARLCEEGIRFKNIALEDKTFLLALGAVAYNVEGADAALEKHPSYDSLLSAMNLFQEAINKAPKYARAHYELGNCNVLLGRFATARTLLDAAVLYSPNNLAILNSLGEVLIETGQWEDAARIFKKVLAVDAESGRANFGLARAYAGMQSDSVQCQAALDALDRAMQLGVHDARIYPSKKLILKDGEVQGRVKEEGAEYVVHRGSLIERIPKAKVERIEDVPGLHSDLLTMIARFERGEKPSSGPVLRGKHNTQPHDVAPPADPWRPNF